ncbi:hypothetical protein PUNSTDRAFT_143071 [Punctularia strigosozonata HHB-11173 SS5]|uniref:uncharacterized protein n=1 Tax=Punctularia strigosozonata (strain HHB-11173) TaxID=741275 RepID=UPI0004417440|nr:uncharacterized protein PUNSTDRAFT_143071 [Punctularia strigosozonata HHB-11173 SS5]EIN09541.1 hypothetical protein PUNSTDRAFT_143071 [Punctularia strigosozonata HHB-11173 SS5]
MSTSEHISPLSYVLEPAIVAGLLTAGCLLNRRRASELKLLDAGPNTPPAAPTTLPFFKWRVRVPDNSRFRHTLTSRFLAYFPFLMEVWYWLNTYWIYQIARAISALTLVDETTAIARKHGIQILTLEGYLGLRIELAVQHWVMRSPLAIDWLNKIYSYVHIPATIAFMVYFFKYAPPPVFRRVRRTLVCCNLLAFIVFTAWPCMPPRLLPYEEYGFVDTVHAHKHASAWTTNKFQNQLAAMPSLHFGYSFVIGMSLFFFSPHKWVARAGPFYPALILLAIVSTANHYILDAVAGFFVSVIAWKINWVLLNLRPLEEWGFWLCRTEKPMDKEIFVRLTGLDKHLPYPVMAEGRRSDDLQRRLLSESESS